MGRFYETHRASLVLVCFFSLNDKADRAIELLREAFALNAGLLEWSQQDSDLDALRELPEYQALFEEPAQASFSYLESLRLRQAPPIDYQSRPGSVRRGLASQEKHRAGDLFGSSDAAQRAIGGIGQKNIRWEP